MPSSSGGISVTSPHAYYSCYLKKLQQSTNAFASTIFKIKIKKKRKFTEKSLTSQTHNPSTHLAKSFQQPGP